MVRNLEGEKRDGSLDDAPRRAGLPRDGVKDRYREVLALSIHRRRPDFEVLLAPPGSLDGRAERFGPHVLMQDLDEAGLPPALPDGVLCRIQLLDTGRMDATIELDGTASEIHDVGLEDLIEVLEEAERLSYAVVG